MKIYEKNINYENRLFGKRLLQAESVISMSKFKRDYDIKRNHKLSRQNNTSWSLRLTSNYYLILELK
jgi:hypothetical protein